MKHFLDSKSDSMAKSCLKAIFAEKLVIRGINRCNQMINREERIQKYLNYKKNPPDFGVNTEMKFRLTIGTFGNRVSGFDPKSNPLQTFEKTDRLEILLNLV